MIDISYFQLVKQKIRPCKALQFFLPTGIAPNLALYLEHSYNLLSQLNRNLQLLIKYLGWNS